MQAFAELCEAVSTTPSRIRKVQLVAQFLTATAAEDLVLAATFCSGRAVPVSTGALRFGGSQVVAAAESVLAFTPRELAAAYDRHGDLGAAIGELVALKAPPRNLFFQALTLRRAGETFQEIARLSGAGATRRRTALFATLLADATPLEAKYLVKLVTGDLRIGLKEALVVDALAVAFGRGRDDVRKALMASGAIGDVAVLACENRLPTARVAYGKPIGFMLAAPIAYGGSYGEIQAGMYLVEDKFDGIRAQAHVKDGRAFLYSRRLNEVSLSYPEVAADLAAIDADVVLDGELLAWQDGRALPFQALQSRLSRIAPDDEILRRVPVAFVAFDLLAQGDEFLIDAPLRERRNRLEALTFFGQRIIVSAAQWLELESPLSSADRAGLEARFEAARARGNEGLMLKASGSAYLPGRRGKQWFKLKRELATLDCVVVAVEYGHGKRNAVLSDYTFAVRQDDSLLTVGKAYSGLTDAEIAQQTAWFLAHTRGRQGRRLIVEPAVVVEIAFDVVQPSTLHESGFALRFPRIVRLRPDKSVADASTLEEVRALAQQ
ncbi:MAG: ATP-dependent DNA ligase [Candidatus Eremiobacteraeota bacterium]|nr:ATP-dependent DNA ligase [Candidatus Eremiobacteraeota bacterium]